VDSGKPIKVNVFNKWGEKLSRGHIVDWVIAYDWSTMPPEIIRTPWIWLEIPIEGDKSEIYGFEYYCEVVFDDDQDCNLSNSLAEQIFSHDGSTDVGPCSSMTH